MSRRSHYRSSKPSRSGQHGAPASSQNDQPPAGNGAAGSPRPPMPGPISSVVSPSPAPPFAVPASTPSSESPPGHLPAARRQTPRPNGNGHAGASNERPYGHAHAPAGNGHAAHPPANGEAAGVRPAAAADRPVDGQLGAAVGCTAPQLRRFIKSRSWVPMHELRRRFAINGSEDDVTPVAVDGGTIFVGLPQREGRLLGELFHAGDIGYELSMDPCTPIVIGVYPMRPVPRH